MALIGKNTKCALCREIIGSEPAAGFPHFVRNRKDPLYVLSDAAVHRRCMDASPLREQAQRRLDERRSRMRDRVCETCKQAINEDWYTTDFLTDDPKTPLYEFNYLHFHRTHLFQWSRFNELRHLVDEFTASQNYDGPPILPTDH